ncbi:hypothetical protein [Microcoleus sp.]|uniref:hypothetical protein n=1 Tax=Microcoleus sp. TaxID=44472 RepID=UPI00403EE6E7
MVRYALCPMPDALCPMPVGQIVPHVNERRYTYSVAASRTVQPSLQSLYCRDRFFRIFANKLSYFLYNARKNPFGDRQSQTLKRPKFLV